ncbi:MAG TPA: carboxypeptidase-like regulatory domain-containing protein [Flavobacteriales bacterium]|nr:carboxypeptidase-like regulatory domain-containing protein [Flavobacteriales bacterium]HPH81766.1 carboxypeptidase-like regulatory domain-containing protein [Flavobacteriales bacterium]
MKTQLMLFLMLCALEGTSQTINGQVLEENDEGITLPLTGVSVYWLGTNIAVQSDSLGNFQIADEHLHSKLILSFTGYRPDTLTLTGSEFVRVTLHQRTQLRTLEIAGKQSSTYLSKLGAIKTEVITTAELCKAACCNLSESFETNNSIDVSTTDAVTGTKKITMLGLSGIYTQITQENLPAMRGLASSSGLQQLPGTWIESIQISKGVGSVANGFESITGQINLELKKPFTDETLLLNGYVNQMGRMEVNLSKAIALNEKWGTVLLVHGDQMKKPIDRNKDKFMDVTDGNQWNILNRWMYRSGKQLSGQFGIQALGDNRRAGTAHQGNEFDVLHDWRFNKDVLRFDAFGKLGYIFQGRSLTSIGILGNAQMNQQRTILGNRWYDADQQSAYGSLIFQSFIGNSNHTYRTGFNVQYDSMKEYFTGQPFGRKELVAGAFFEYTWKSGMSTLVAGIRADHNFLYGNFATPRLHYKLAFSEKTALHVSGGRGQRTATILDENISYLVSSRLLLVKANAAAQGKGYGLLPEIGWTGGIGFSTQFELAGQEGSLSADAYMTWFERQVVVDADFSPQQLRIYNLDGNSQSVSTQVDYNQALGKRFDLRLSYKFTQTQTQYLSGTFQRPFVSPHRALLNLAFHSRKDKWLVDATANFIGSKRLPSSVLNPVAYQADSHSPDYVMVHAQVTRNLNRWAVYVGVENLLDVYQQNQIISSDDPHSKYFDASYSWGPGFGRMVYAGFRYKIMKS